MSARRVDVQDVVARYAAGFFPLYDPFGRFYWERLAVRAVIPVNAHTVKRARQLGRRGRKRFEIRYTTAVEQVIAQLQDESVKENSWVKEEVVRIYGALFAAGLLQTVEAWREGKLVGALLGIVLPGTFIAETMFGLEPEASKICLCRLVEDCAALGIEMIDVQTPHDRREILELAADDLPELREYLVKLRAQYDGKTAHPCMRLGEEHVALSKFMTALRMAWKRAFDGGVKGWVDRMTLLRDTPWKERQLPGKRG